MLSTDKHQKWTRLPYCCYLKKCEILRNCFFSSRLLASCSFLSTPGSSIRLYQPCVLKFNTSCMFEEFFWRSTQLHKLQVHSLWQFCATFVQDAFPFSSQLFLRCDGFPVVWSQSGEVFALQLKTVNREETIFELIWVQKLYTTTSLAGCKNGILLHDAHQPCFLYGDEC